MTLTTNQPTNQPTTRSPRPHYGRSGSPRPAVVIALLGKGGSGKTTSCAALGDALAREQHLRVELVDVDQQASLTSWLLPDLAPDDLTVDDVLLGGAAVSEVRRTLRPDLNLTPASNGLAAIEPTLDPLALQSLLLDVADADVVLIDTRAMAPLGPGAVILRSVLAAADVVVAPFRPSVIDLDALDETLSQVRAHVDRTGRTLPVLLLPTMTSTRDGSVELVTRSLRLGGLSVLPAIPASSWAPKAAGARELLADRAPASSSIVTAYGDAAADLAAVVAAVRA